MKRILVVQNHYIGFGGDDTVVANESALLATRGHEVSLWTLRNDELKGLGARITTAFQLPYNRSAREGLARRIVDFQPDLIHCHNLFPRITVSAYDAAAHAGVPVVQTLHDFRLVCCANAFLYRAGETCERCVQGSPYWGAWHRCYRDSFVGSWLVARSLAVHRNAGTLARGVHRFIALSDSLKRRFVQAGLPAERIAVKPNFTPEPALPDSEPGPGAPRPRQGALFVGRLSPEKGLSTLMEAWATLRHPLRILGTGPLAQELAGHGHPCVTLLGHRGRAEVARAMQEAEFLVMPSEWIEGFPMVIVEAFANGLPIIASRLGAMAEMIEHGKTGLHFTPRDPLDLARTVAWAVAHPAQMAAMGAAARQTVRARYGEEVNYRLLMTIYQQAAETAAAE